MHPTPEIGFGRIAASTSVATSGMTSRARSSWKCTNTWNLYLPWMNRMNILILSRPLSKWWMSPDEFQVHSIFANQPIESEPVFCGPFIHFKLPFDVWRRLNALQALEPMRNCISVVTYMSYHGIPNHQIKIRNVFQWRGHILWTPPPSQAKKYKIKVRERVVSHTIKWYWWHLLGS